MIEDRLRATLAELADEVPKSQHPRADLDRRLARHRSVRRRVVIVTAAAAVVVVAGVAVPVVLDGPPQVDRSSAPDIATEADHHVLGTFTENGTTYQAVARLRGDELCVGRSDQPEAGCEPVPTWPTPDTHSLVTSRTVLGGGLPDSGPLPNLLLFLTAPEVATLEVREAYGSPRPVTVLEQTPRFTLYLVDFGGSSQGFGYTAKNASGTVLEEAIT